MGYDGAPIAGERIRLVAPGPDFDAAVALHPESFSSRSELSGTEWPWAVFAATDDRSLLFAIEVDGAVIGDCGLHDIVRDSCEAMLGYHIFLPENRERGFGSDAVRTLVRYAREELGLRRLVAITGVENTASRRTAMSAGLRFVGEAREGPHLVVFVLEEASRAAL